jgi:hypothetical protein
VCVSIDSHIVSYIERRRSGLDSLEKEKPIFNNNGDLDNDDWMLAYPTVFSFYYIEKATFKMA